MPLDRSASEGVDDAADALATVETSKRNVLKEDGFDLACLSGASSACSPSLHQANLRAFHVKKALSMPHALDSHVLKSSTIAHRAWRGG